MSDVTAETVKTVAPAAPESPPTVLEQLFFIASSDDENSIKQPSPPSFHEERQDVLPTTAIERIKVIKEYSLPELCSECCVTIAQCPQHGIAHQIWPAAMFLCSFLLRYPQFITNNGAYQTVDILELGAGLGLSGLFLKRHFSHKTELQNAECNKSPIDRVILTDLPEAIPGIKENIVRNGFDEYEVAARVLSWGVMSDVDTLSLNSNCNILYDGNSCFEANSSSNKAVIAIAADVVYWECLFQPLVDTLSYLLSPKIGVKAVFIAHIKRWKRDGKFFTALKKALLNVECLQEEVILATEDSLEKGVLDENDPGSVERKKLIRRVYKVTK